MKNSILGKARWLREAALATSKNNGARVAREWLRYAAMFVMLLTLGSGNVWGALPANPTWTATALADIADGATVIIIGSSNALPSTTTNSNPTKISCTVTTSAGVSTISPASGTLQNLAWTVDKLTSSWKFYQEGSNTIRLYLSATNSNTALRVGNASSNNDQFVMGSGGKLLKVTTAGRYVGPYSGGSDWRTYNSETHANYNSASLTFYVLNTGGGSTPTITTSVSSLSEVGYSTTDFSQQVKSFKVSGSNLKADVTVTAPTNYEVCKTADGTYAPSVSFSKGSGTLSASDVYVRLKSGKTAGNYSGDISCTSTDATEKTVGLSGSVPFKVTWKANGTTHATTYVAYATSPGTALGTLPSDPDPEDYTCDEKAFYGWYDGDTYDNPSVAPTLVSTSDKITTDKTYNAVFATATGSGGTSTLVASAQGWGNGDEATQKTISTVTYTWAKNSGTNKPAYYDSGYAVRLYQENNGTNGNQVTISSSNTITGIVFTYVDGYAFLTNAPSVGTLTAAGVWSGSATSIVFKNKNNAQVRIQSIVVTYGTLSYSNYATTCQACVAPTSVSVDGTWRRFPGETITLTATPTGGTGTPSYQWQKYIVDTWTDIDGATSATFTKSNCTTSDAGQYRCVVSTGTNCSEESDGYNVRIYTLLGKYEGGSETSYNITVSSGTTGTVAVPLEAGRIFRFKVVDNVDKGFGNEGRILKDESNWNFWSDNNNFAYLFTGPEGNYTFTINTANSGASPTPNVAVSVAYPDLGHPVAGYAYYKNVDSWGSVKVHMWYEGGGQYTEWASDPVISTTATICNQTYYYTPLIPSWYNRVIFHDGGGGSGQTGNITYADLAAYSGKYNDKSDNNWHAFATYSITYSGGDGSTGGPMTPHTGLCPGSDQPLTANAFSKAYHTFDGWSDGNGHTYANLATIENIQSDINLTAQWAPAQYSVTHTLSNATTQSGATGANAATYGTNYTATFAAAQGYVLPSTISVTAGGSNITANCTWTQATGSLTIPGAYITGNIVITITSKASYTLTFSTKSGYGSPSGGKIDETNLSFNGSGTVTNPLVEGQTLTFPSVSSFAADECSTTFEGWSTNPSCATAPTIKAGDVLVLSGASGSTTYYAVYSQVEEGGGDFDPSEDVDGDFYITNENKSYYMNHTVYNNSYFESTAAANKSAANNLFHITKITSGTDAGKFIISFVSGNSTKYVKVYNNGSNVAISVDNTTGVALSIAATSTSGAHGTYEATYGNNTRGLMFRSNDGNNSFRNYAISNAPNTGYSLLEFEPAASKTYTTNPTCTETFTVTLTGGEGASVDVTGGNVKYNGGTAARFAENDAVSISATPTTGYSFSGWSITKEHGGSVTPASSAASTTFTMPADNVTVTATFSPILVSSLKLRAQQTGQSDKTGNNLTMNCYPKEGQTGGNDPLNHTLNVAFYEVLPADALDKTYTWSVRVKASGAADWTNVDFTGNQLNTNAIINYYNNNTGLLKIGTNEGTAEIKITANDASGVSAKVTITVAKVSVTSISVDPTSMNVYAGQKKTVTITFTPLNASDKAYTTGSYSYVTIRSSGSNPFYIEGNATEVVRNETVTVTSHDGSHTATIAVTVNPLPKATFVDIVQDKKDFDGVPSTGILSSTVDDGGLTVTTTKNTPTHADVAEPATGNPCEKSHLHLVGWILKDWADENPDATSSQISGAGAGYFYAAGSEIDLVAKDGKTFYAVWAKEVTTP